MKTTKLFDARADMGVIQNPRVNEVPHIYATKDGKAYISDLKFMMKYKDGSETKRAYLYTDPGIPTEELETPCYVLRDYVISSITKCENIETIYLNGDLGIEDSAQTKTLFTSMEHIFLGPYGEYIGSNAFINCTTLKSLNMVAGTDHICLKTKAFEGATNLEFVNIVNSYRKKASKPYQLDTSLFKGCTKLKTLFIEDKTQNIEANACSGCTLLEYVYLPLSVAQISSNAFHDCTSLKTIEFNSTMATLKGQLKISTSGAFTNCLATTIKCTDGNIPISSIPTYTPTT